MLQKVLHCYKTCKVGTVLAKYIHEAITNKSLSIPSTTGETEMIKFALKALTVATVAASSFSVFAEEAKSPVTGTVGVYNKYIFRGGVEDDSTAIQAGLNYAFANGVNRGLLGFFS